MNRKMLEHSFSVELNSRDHVRLVALDTDRKQTLIEGILGELMALDFIEDALLEIKGKNGTLRIDLDSEDLKKISHHKNGEVFKK